MQSRPPLPKLQWRREKFDQHHMYQAQSYGQQALASPVLHPGKIARRQMLVSEFFKEVKEIRNSDNGYGFRFDQSDDLDALEDLLTKIAQYILFESLNSPRLTFAIDEEPKTNGFWLQVRSVEGSVPDIAVATVSTHSTELP